ncbi:MULTISPECIES: hypothetical protein [unclassified Halomonas]|uniref:hypothetical protein n=1 Tax=unclassified Halomonas TaxID=2609666 RepID=UPI0007D975BF|nr:MULTISPECIES: hypothetical protein [unclassified Halomonas]MBT2788625.1 hypothetical protein [Halomonas sp. ISL-106]MBT2798216.1 hypothetical protein [Halomonas sp. ISL-104]OAL60766.1 hypothetical protein A6R74_18815 [Halomonas sp. ALS9]
MDIEQLRQVRNKNVQQQNQLKYLEMKQEAESFCGQPDIYPWLVAVLLKHGLRPSDGLLVSCSSVPEQEGNEWIGVWITGDRRFFEFDVMADRASGELLRVDAWEEFSPEMSAHRRGIGETFGYLALRLLTAYESLE